eukprot:CAMPEP_0117648398 /NCGR_PEP_ID=MMETSP0804-20121206/378_1 /TAXON_ID=1074897 /ORGANISM="Tetraselmis astigmatica, Strain CCMP880" /LENGTH=175 /DNA_ID=CAMNT_0005453987 /DNA_START=74 /DNA_END=602 /DNA_ORIENTATION=-
MRSSPGCAVPKASIRSPKSSAHIGMAAPARCTKYADRHVDASHQMATPSAAWLATNNGEGKATANGGREEVESMEKEGGNTRCLLKGEGRRNQQKEDIFILQKSCGRKKRMKGGNRCLTRERGRKEGRKEGLCIRGKGAEEARQQRLDYGGWTKPVQREEEEKGGRLQGDLARII